MKSPQEPSIGRHIQRIEAEGLFGQFDHDLKFGEKPPDNTNLLILYGENGTGKTTLLWLVYHLLNKDLGAGHRTYLSQFRFRKLCVTFSDGVEISAIRNEPSAGGFSMLLREGLQLIAKFTFTMDPDGSLKPVWRDKVHLEFNEKLPEFNLGFLPHSRLTIPDEDPRSRCFQACLRGFDCKAGSLPLLDSPTRSRVARRQAQR